MKAKLFIVLYMRYKKVKKYLETICLTSIKKLVNLQRKEIPIKR